MIDDDTKEWLQRMAHGWPDKAGGTPHRTEGSEHARRILAVLDDADRDDATLAAIENELPDPDDLSGQIKRLVTLRERLAETMDEHDYRGTDGNEPTDDDIAVQFGAAVAFRLAVMAVAGGEPEDVPDEICRLTEFHAAVRAMLIGTGVLAETDQTTDLVALLRLFLPSPAKVAA